MGEGDMGYVLCALTPLSKGRRRRVLFRFLFCFFVFFAEVGRRWADRCAANLFIWAESFCATADRSRRREKLKSEPSTLLSMTDLITPAWTSHAFWLHWVYAALWMSFRTWMSLKIGNKSRFCGKSLCQVCDKSNDTCLEILSNEICADFCFFSIENTTFRL